MFDVRKLTAALIGRKKAAEEKRAFSVHDFATAIADGELTSEAKILAGLDEFRITPEQLEAQIQTLLERRRLQQIVEQESATKQQQAAELAEFERAEAKLNVAQAAHRLAIEKHNRAVSATNAKLMQIADAKVKLGDTLPAHVRRDAERFDDDFMRISQRVGELKENLATTTLLQLDRRTRTMVPNFAGQRAAFRSTVNGLRSATAKLPRGERNLRRPSDSSSNLTLQRLPRGRNSKNSSASCRHFRPRQVMREPSH